MDKEKTIIVKSGSSYISIGNGYESIEEVEERIEEQFNPGNHTYGFFEEMGEVEIPEPTYDGEDIDEKAENIIQSLKEKCESDERVKSFCQLDHAKWGRSASFNCLTIRYSVYEVDFGIKLSNDLFNEVPVSTYDTEAEEKIKSILADLSEDVVYLGFNSSYASRGRRNPFVTVYGRANRGTKSDEYIRSLEEYDGISSVLYTDDNISPVSIYELEPHDEYAENDVIAVFSMNGSKNLENISSNNIELCTDIIESIRENTNLKPVWLGKILYGHDRKFRLCAGIKK